MNKLNLAKTALIVLVCALGFMLGNDSRADGIYVGGWSHHFNADKFEEHGWDLNENQRFVAVEYNNYLAGHFYNSYGDSTYFAAKYFKAFSFGDLEFGAHVGASYGYKFCAYENSMHDSSQLCAMAGPVVSYTKFAIQPTLIAIKDGFVVTFKWGF